MSFADMFDPDLFVIHAPMLFIWGALFGSFFNVCIYRIPSGQAIGTPSSHCYACGTKIKWYDNVPLFGYLILRGRCRTCRTPFSIRYAMVELLNACLFLAVFLRYGYTWATLAFLVFTGLLLVATFTDIDHWIIPDRISYGGALIGIGLALGMAFLTPRETHAWIVAHAGPISPDPWHWWGPVVNSIVGALSGAGLLWVIGLIGSLIFRMPAMGLGDSKLLLCIGAFCGWQVAILCIFLASFFGAAHGLVLILIKKFGNKPPLPPAKDTEEIDALLDDESEAAAARGWTYSDGEKQVLKDILSGKSHVPARRHHLPFGPHLALAAWILMLFEEPCVRWFAERLSITLQQ